MPSNNVAFGFGLVSLVGGFVLAAVLLDERNDNKVFSSHSSYPSRPILSPPSNETIRKMIDLDVLEYECANEADVKNQWIRDKNRIRYSGFCAEGSDSHADRSLATKSVIGCTKSQFHIDETMEWAIPYCTQTMGNLLWMKLSHGIKLGLMRESGSTGLSISVFSNKSTQHFIEYKDEFSIISHYYFSVHELNKEGMVFGEALYNVELDVHIKRDGCSKIVTCSWN
jgi:hypothetical protein